MLRHNILTESILITLIGNNGPLTEMNCSADRINRETLKGTYLCTDNKVSRISVARERVHYSGDYYSIRRIIFWTYGGIRFRHVDARNNGMRAALLPRRLQLLYLRATSMYYILFDISTRERARVVAVFDGTGHFKLLPFHLLCAHRWK